MKKFTLGIVLSIVFLLMGTMHAQISTFPYAESFEGGPAGWASDAGPNDTWALGTPAKAVIIGASDGANAWVTSLAGLYLNNQQSAIESPVFDFSAAVGDPTIKMDVWWESEFSWDGAVLQSSTDGGTTWANVGAFGDPLNWYTDNTINGAPGGSQEGWTGRNGSGSPGWVEAEHLLDGMAGQSAVTLRVAFGSDGSVQDDGFAFDNVRVTLPPPPPISTFPYQETFEAGPGNWVASGSNSSWQLGTPANVVINGAAEGVNSWITNLTGSYNVNEDSNVQSPVFDFSALAADPTFKMSVWWESEFSWDGSNLQSSIDGGATWNNVGVFGDPNNWYTDNTINGTPGGSPEGWTGRNGSGSPGWVEAEHALDGLAGQPAVSLRVTFGSDGSVQDDGFAFDDVRIGIGDPPVIACPADLMIDTTAGQCTGVANWADPIALDTEDGPLPTTQTMGPASGSAFPTGDTIIEYSVTDSDGNTSTCQFTVTVTDNEAPVAVCQDLTVELDAAGMFTITPNDIDNGSSDNCGIVTYAFGGAPGAPASLTTSFVTNNGSAGNMFDVMPLNDINVNSFDVNNSSTTTVDYEIYFKAGTYVGSETTAGDWTLVGSALGVAGAGQDNPTPLGLSMGVTLTAGNTYAFYVADIGPGTHRYINGGTAGDLWAADANLEIYEGAGKGGLFGSTFSPRNFSGTIVYETGAVPPFGGTFTCADVGTNTIILEVTDAEGNTTACTSTVTVEDNIAPEIVCIGEQIVGPNTVSDAPGTAIVDNTTVSTTITVTDDLVITDLNVDMNITHTWTGDLQITLESPTGTQVLIFDGSADGCSGDNIYDIYDDESVNVLACQAGTADAFPEDDYIPSNALSAFDGESTLGTWILFVEDTAGGDPGTIDSWGLIYDFDPIVAPPFDVVLDANGNATVNAADLLLGVNEACGWTATVGGAPAPSTLFTTLAGGNGNFGNMFDMNALGDVTIDSFDIHGDVGAVFDVEVYAKAGTYVGFETDAAAWTLIGTAPGVVSNGDGVVTPLNLALNYAMAAGETHAFYVTPTDFSTGGFNYTNGTTVGAVFAADANLEFLEGAGSGYPFNGTLFSPRVFNGNIQYSAGGGPSTTLDVDCSNLGENLIEVTVTDASGNVAMCTATVNVIDDTDPILVCWDTTIELGADGTAVVDPMALLAVLPSSYNVMTISSDNQSGAPGETDLTVPVTDAASITFDWDYSTPDGPGFDSFGYLLNGVYTELTDPAGATNQNGSAGPIAVVAGDVFGFRSASVDGLFGPCTTVVSNFMPGFTGQFDPANWTETLNNSDGSAMFVELPGGPLSFDACGITILAVDVTEVTCADIGTPVVITVFASDASGNIAACTSTVTVVDLLAPVVTCPADITVDPGVGNLFYEVPDYFGTGEATALDNCTDPLTLLSQDPAAGTLLPDGVYTVTMTAEDEYGNIGTCTFELTVESVLGLDDNELDIAISMYPNPAETQVTITNSSNIQLEKAAIYDMNGKLIQQVDLSLMTGEKVIDVSYLSAGVYIVQITSDESSAIKRLIKE